MSEHSITREHFFKMIELQTQTMRDLYEENIQLRKDVVLLARELDNTLGAIMCNAGYQEEYMDANLNRLETLVGKHSKKECEFRIKPKREKLYIAVKTDKHEHLGGCRKVRICSHAFVSKEDAESYLDLSDSQLIEIEVDV